MKHFLFFITSLMLTTLVQANEGAHVIQPHVYDLTTTTIGYITLVIFVIAYALVMSEEFTHLRKSKPMILAAGIIWGMIGWYAAQHGLSEQAEQSLRYNLLEYAELLLFLLVAMTYINAMADRLVFEALRVWLIQRGYGFRQLFWMTGILAFFISPIADNLTTALLMCAVIVAVGGSHQKFVGLACINIVVASNAGGAFSPFGDITTLMVWQAEKINFWGFFSLFIPSAVNFLIPAMILHFAIPNEKPTASANDITMHRGAIPIIFLFLITIATAVAFHNSFHLPPVIGMLTGLSCLQLYGYYLKKTAPTNATNSVKEGELGEVSAERHFDVFKKVERAEWDTLFFFYGVILAVGGMGFLGYLALASDIMYTQWGATHANIFAGILSAIIDNIPVMFAILSMNPVMSEGQWLLVTLTAGVGGSLLSIGSAAGVALMGASKGQYTFFLHLKWTWAIALGYITSIWVHLWLNAALF